MSSTENYNKLIKSVETIDIAQVKKLLKIAGGQDLYNSVKAKLNTDAYPDEESKNNFLRKITKGLFVTMRDNNKPFPIPISSASAPSSPKNKPKKGLYIAPEIKAAPVQAIVQPEVQPEVQPAAAKKRVFSDMSSSAPSSPKKSKKAKTVFVAPSLINPPGALPTTVEGLASLPVETIDSLTSEQVINALTSEDDKKRFIELNNKNNKNKSTDYGIDIRQIAQAYKIPGRDGMTKINRILNIIIAEKTQGILPIAQEGYIPSLAAQVPSQAPSQPPSRASSRPSSPVGAGERKREKKVKEVKEKDCGEYNHAELLNMRLSEVQEILKSKGIDAANITSKDEAANLVCQYHKNKEQCDAVNGYGCSPGLVCSVNSNPGVCVDKSSAAATGTNWLDNNGHQIVGNEEVIRKIRKQLKLKKYEDTLENGPERDKLIKIAMNNSGITKAKYFKRMSNSQIRLFIEGYEMINKSKQAPEVMISTSTASTASTASRISSKASRPSSPKAMPQAVSAPTREQKINFIMEVSGAEKDFLDIISMDVINKYYKGAIKLSGRDPYPSVVQAEAQPEAQPEVQLEQQPKQPVEEMEVEEENEKPLEDIDVNDLVDVQPAPASPKKVVSQPQVEDGKEIIEERRRQDNIGYKELEAQLANVMAVGDQTEDFAEIKNTVLRCLGLISV